MTDNSGGQSCNYGQRKLQHQLILYYFKQFIFWRNYIKLLGQKGDYKKKKKRFGWWRHTPTVRVCISFIINISSLCANVVVSNWVSIADVASPYWRIGGRPARVNSLVWIGRPAILLFPCSFGSLPLKSSPTWLSHLFLFCFLLCKRNPCGFGENWLLDASEFRTVFSPPLHPLFLAFHDHRNPPQPLIFVFIIIFIFLSSIYLGENEW